jgi:ketosteroid isomerase-like protein
VIDGGDNVVVPVRVQARARNGRMMDVRNVWVYEFEGPTIRRAQVYADTAVLRDTVAGLTGEG